jgi:tetratricopeptide (TPR) repeat protein
MALHLSQQFYEAMEAWQLVANSGEADDELKSLAWYWRGVEDNNLGNFDEAIRNFGQAQANAKGLQQKHELSRIILENRFFNRESAESLIQPLEELLNSIKSEGRAELGETEVRTLITLGNVCYEAGNDLQVRDINSARGRYTEAEARFDEAARRKAVWAWFGLAQAKDKLGKSQEAEAIFQKEARHAARAEYIRKEELRTKLIALMQELMCCLRLPILRNEVPLVYSQVASVLSQVDSRLTLYSSVQHRNIRRDDFERELSELMQGI